MKSLCIKTNYDPITDYLLRSLENSNLDNTYVSIKNFKHFRNFIVHYKATDSTNFNTYLASSITKVIIAYYEKELIANQINLNYFYFHSYEKKQILENTFSLLADKKLSTTRYHSIYKAVFEEIQKSHAFYLQAFIHFHLKEYIDLINNQIDIAVNQFLINKEYIEFVNILKLYIKSEASNSQVNHLHLIYQNKTSIIVDDNKNMIACNDNMRKAKYISDISFSSNDFALNTLLNLVPKKITIHLVDNNCDEFINTLKLIFQNQVCICEDCDICHLYRRKKLKN